MQALPEQNETNGRPIRAFVKMAMLASRALLSPDFEKDSHCALNTYREAVALTQPWLDRIEKNLEQHGSLVATQDRGWKSADKSKTRRLPFLRKLAPLIGRSPKTDQGTSPWKLKMQKELHKFITAEVRAAEAEIRRLERLLEGKHKRRRKRRPATSERGSEGGAEESLYPVVEAASTMESQAGRSGQTSTRGLASTVVGPQEAQHATASTGPPMPPYSTCVVPGAFGEANMPFQGGVPGASIPAPLPNSNGTPAIQMPYPGMSQYGGEIGGHSVRQTRAPTEYSASRSPTIINWPQTCRERAVPPTVSGPEPQSHTAPNPSGVRKMPAAHRSAHTSHTPTSRAKQTETSAPPSATSATSSGRSGTLSAAHSRGSKPPSSSLEDPIRVQRAWGEWDFPQAGEESRPRGSQRVGEHKHSSKSGSKTSKTARSRDLPSERGA